MMPKTLPDRGTKQLIRYEAELGEFVDSIGSYAYLQSRPKP